MNIREAIHHLQTGDLRTDEERRMLKPLLAVLSPPSIQTMRTFQNQWDGDRPFDEFMPAQDSALLQCIELELSPIGVDVRAELNLPPLSEDTELV